MKINLPKDIFPCELFNISHIDNDILIINLGNRILIINQSDSNHFYLYQEEYDDTIWSLGVSKRDSILIYTNYKSIFYYDIKEKIKYLCYKNFNACFGKYISTNKELLYISNDFNLEKIDLETKEVIYSKKIEYDSTYDPIDLSNDNKYLAVEGKSYIKYSKVINVYNVETGDLVITLSGFDIQDDKKHLDYQLEIKNNIVYFLPYSREYHQDYFNDYFSKIGTDKEFFIEDVNFVKSIVFSQDSKELLVYCEGDCRKMFNTKIFDTDTWEVKERIYDYIKENPVFMKDSDLIISFDSSYKTTNIYSRSQKKTIKTIDKILHFSADKTKYGNFITEDGEKYFEIKDIEEIFNE